MVNPQTILWCNVSKLQHLEISSMTTYINKSSIKLTVWCKNVEDVGGIHTRIIATELHHFFPKNVATLVSHWQHYMR